MKRLLLLVFLVTTMAFLSACSSRRTTTVNFASDDLSDARLERIENAQTTADWVRLALGKPHEVRATERGPLWVYVRRSDIVYHDEGGREEWQQRTAYIQFDDAGNVIETWTEQSESERWHELGQDRPYD